MMPGVRICAEGVRSLSAVAWILLLRPPFVREADRQEPRWRLEPSILRLAYSSSKTLSVPGARGGIELFHYLIDIACMSFFEQTEEANKKANNFFLRSLLFRLKPY
jgi:hypothetical protein